MLTPLRPLGVGRGGCEAISEFWWGLWGVCVSKMCPSHVSAEMRVRVRGLQSGFVWAAGLHHGNPEPEGPCGVGVACW